HRLMACRREIEDGQAPKAQGDSDLGIHPGAFVIGAAMHQCAYHWTHRCLQFFAAGRGSQKSGYSTHLRKTNSLLPSPPPQVFNLTKLNPLFLYQSKIASGLATSKGYPPNQSNQSRTRDIPRFL